MGQHCSINIKWDYSPAVVSLLSSEPLKCLQNSRGFLMGGIIVQKPDHPEVTSCSRLCTQPLQKFSNVLKSFLWWVCAMGKPQLPPFSSHWLLFPCYFPLFSSMTMCVSSTDSPIFPFCNHAGFRARATKTHSFPLSPERYDELPFTSQHIQAPIEQKRMKSTSKVLEA